MSIFRTVDVPCPTCSTPVSFELVLSVNADRRPDLRAAILDGSFQRQDCPACGFTFRMEPEFSYIDIGRGQFFAVWPASKLATWKAHEAHSRSAFDKAFGKDAPAEARRLGDKIAARAVFGWAALNEKLIAADAGIADLTLELAKAGVIRKLEDSPVGGDFELRLVGVEGADLMLAWLRVGSEQPTEVLSVPRDLIGEIEADPGPWQALRDELSQGVFVDLQRTLLAGEVAA